MIEPSMTTKAALEAYYRSHYFGDEALTDAWVMIRWGPLRFPFPNPKARREAIQLHDLTHLLTGYDTSWTGEGEIAAWELASGFPRKYWIGWIYSPITFVIGLVISPLRVLRAFRKGWGQSNLYQIDIPREQLECLTLAELHARLKGKD